jgi:hypothetical protein
MMHTVTITLSASAMQKTSEIPRGFPLENVQMKLLEDGDFATLLFLFWFVNREGHVGQNISLDFRGLGFCPQIPHLCFIQVKNVSSYRGV